MMPRRLVDRLGAAPRRLLARRARLPVRPLGPGLALALAVAGPACSPFRSGLAEPLRVREGTFIGGVLPGFDPADGGSAGAGPFITAYDSANRVVEVRQAGKVLAGRTSPDAWSVALALRGLGTGYWVLPVGGIDPTAGGERVFQATVDLGEIDPGPRTLSLSAVGGDGRGGPRTDAALCVVPQVPDNLNACDPSLAPPAAVISLDWDSDVDLDLVAISPDGKRVDWRHPTTALPSGGQITDAALAAPDLGRIDRNSNAGCVIDGRRRENLVWQQAPRPGTWRIYASLFSSCGWPSTGAHVRVYRRRAESGGTFSVAAGEEARGTLTAAEESGGATLGLALIEVALP